ncbi:hypothetical protein AVEN_110804-1 [Araneus ventricosus]|uniref:Uncharacterized protein n=1 Tax=Araneus ventricosus TaxID=182803 RepID=A0A4Y2GF63_ARAVE|nr:hypothetical protein AVEN_110804-1 [Araneus ventricosus]
MLVSSATRLQTTLPNKLPKKGLNSIFRPRNIILKKCLGTSLSINDNKTGIQATLGDPSLMYFLKSPYPKPHVKRIQPFSTGTWSFSQLSLQIPASSFR